MIDFSNLPQDIIKQFNLFGLEQLPGFRFAVQIDGLPAMSKYVAGFSGVDGLDGSVRIREVQEGGFNGAHEFPRPTTNSAIVLTRGMTLSRSLYNWHQEVANWTKGRSDYRRNVSIVMIDTVSVGLSGTPIPSLGVIVPYEVWRFDIRQAWPSDWRGPRLNAGESQFAVESVTLHHSGLSEAYGLFSGKTGEAVSIFQ